MTAGIFCLYNARISFLNSAILIRELSLTQLIFPYFMLYLRENLGGEVMRTFNYSEIKNQKWDSDILGLIAAIYKEAGKQELYLKQRPGTAMNRKSQVIVMR